MLMMSSMRTASGTQRGTDVTPAPFGTLQRKCACGGSAGITGKCEDCNHKELVVQRSVISQPSGSPTPPIVHEALRSPGQRLDLGTQQFMEQRFGHDFSRVRVHTDKRAADSAAAVNALAYTVGSDLVFAEGQFAPETEPGKRLLAHELTHTLQQNETGIFRQAKEQKKPKIVSLTFKDEDITSEDNKCDLCPLVLGLNCNPVDGFFNGAEFEAWIQDHDPAYSYNFKRTKQHKVAERVDDKWNVIEESAPNAEDDIDDSAEYLRPQYKPHIRYIYDVDQPGLLRRSNETITPELTDEVHIGNYTEFVQIKGRGETWDDEFSRKWHSVVWVRYVFLPLGNPLHIFDWGLSKIGLGHLSSLDPDQYEKQRMEKLRKRGKK